MPDDSRCLRSPTSTPLAILITSAPAARQFWMDNCVAMLGLPAASSNRSNRPASTSSHGGGAHPGLLPTGRPGPPDPADIAEYNALTAREYDNIRDFPRAALQAHPPRGQRVLRYCRAMPVPDTLQRKLDLLPPMAASSATATSCLPRPAGCR